MMVQLTDWCPLWNNPLEVTKYHESGATVHERLYKFLSEYGKLQRNSCNTHKKFCEKYIIDLVKTFGAENSYGLAYNQFLRFIQRLNDVEGLISAAFEVQSSRHVRKYIEEEAHKIKAWKRQRDKLAQEMKNQTKIVDEEIKRYRDKFREMVKANEEFKRADENQMCTRSDVEKASLLSQLKSKEFCQARRTYCIAIEQYNKYRREFYNSWYPKWVSDGYQLEVDRHESTRKLFSVLQDRMDVVVERLKKVSSELVDIQATLCAEKDAAQLIDCYSTDLAPPGDIEAIDLSAPVTFESSDSGEPPVDGISGEDQIYAPASSIILPPNFYSSVRAADIAANYPGRSLEQVNGSSSLNDYGSIYSGASSVTDASANNQSRLSIPSYGVSSTGGHENVGLIRRLFSRRSRSTVNIKRTQQHPDRPLRPPNSFDQSSVYPIVHPVAPREAQADKDSDFSDFSYADDPDENYAVPCIDAASSIPTARSNGVSQPTTAPLCVDDCTVVNNSDSSANPLPTTTDETDADITITEHHNTTATHPAICSESQIIPTQLPPLASSPVNGSRHLSTSLSPAEMRKRFAATRPKPDRTAPPHGSNGQRGQSNDDDYASSVHRLSIGSNSSSSPKQDNYAESSCHRPPNPVSDQLSNGNGVSRASNSPSPVASQSLSVSDSAVVIGTCRALFPFTADGFEACYLPFGEGDQFYMLAPCPYEDSADWLRVATMTSKETGFVPTAYVEQHLYPQPLILPTKSPTQTTSNGSRTSISSPNKRNSRLAGLVRDTDL